MNIVIYGKGKAMNAVCQLVAHLHLSYHQMDDEDRDDTILQSARHIIATPGLKPSHSLYMEYGAKIVSELSFFGLLLEQGYFPRWKDVTIIGITGTNGKSTTTRALTQACESQEAKREVPRPIYIGGNFDTPLSKIALDIIEQNHTQAQPIIILEASSFMLWHLEKFQFTIGILLNIAHDHLDRHGSLEDYTTAKAQILYHTDQAIVSAETIELLNTYGHELSDATIYTPLTQPLPNFLGHHNASNLGAVFTALQQLYPDYDASLLTKIQPVPHRLQPHQLRDGIIFIDDSVSSSEHALGAAIQAMRQPTILIAGGHDNKETYSSLIKSLQATIPVLVCYGTNQEILAKIAQQADIEVIKTETLSEAIQTARDYAKKNNLTYILYSPGSKSFDQFTNVYHRIEVMEQLLMDYQGEKH